MSATAAARWLRVLEQSSVGFYADRGNRVFCQLTQNRSSTTARKHNPPGGTCQGPSGPNSNDPPFRDGEAEDRNYARLRQRTRFNLVRQ